MPTLQQNPDGTWSVAQPLGPQGRLARLELWLRARGHRRLAVLLGRIDELLLR